MEKAVLHKFFSKVKDHSFSIEYWDGSTESYGQCAPAFKIIFKDKIPKMKILRDPSLALGEAYMDGIIDFEGDLRRIVETAYKINVIGNEKFSGVRKLLSGKNKSSSLLEQQKDIEHHYDLGNDF